MIRLRIKEVREERGWTQTQLGKAIHMRQAAISRLERRPVARRIDVRLLERIARALKCQLRDLLVIEG
jgi:DNA-binding Xre family transcriptional regulator